MTQIPWLEDNGFTFPDVSTALTEPDGLLTASLTLTPELVKTAYTQGVFPWYSDGQPVLWWSPDPRCVIYPEDFHVSRSLRRTLNNNPFEIRVDTAFKDVMLACAEPRRNTDEPGTWITDAMVSTYCRLHDEGIAHSVECWHQDQLAGGIYGLVLGDMFFGESMFSRQKDASKVAMHHISQQIRPSLIDAQVYSKHLETLGAVTIDRHRFIDHIDTHINLSLNI